MERQEKKQEPKIIRTATRILAGAITEATYNYIKAQGYKGTKKKIQRMIYQLQLKELRLGIIYNFTPFGDKEQLDKDLKLIDESKDELYQMTLQENPDIKKAKRIKCMKKDNEENSLKNRGIQEKKQEPKIIRTVTRILAGAITEATYNYIKAQGYKGTKKKIQRMIYQLQLREIWLGIIYNLTPFGDKKQLDKDLKLIDESKDELYQMTLQENPDIKQARRIKCIRK